MKRYKILVIALVLVLITSACTQNANRVSTDNPNIKSENLLTNVKADAKHIDAQINVGEKITDFGIKLLRNARDKGENTMVSPLSVSIALSMVANGSSGETRVEIEEAIGERVEVLNGFFGYYNSIARGSSVNIANSIWYKDSGEVSLNKEFLKAIKTYYSADLFKAPFDKTTIDDINRWVRLLTKDMIKEVLNGLPPKSVMYLINVVTFDSKWHKVYKPSDVHKNIFNTATGDTREVDFLSSHENIYLESKNSVGIMKYYKGERYAFVGILPNENMTLSEYLDSVKESEISEMIKNSKEVEVYADIPKFKNEYEKELSSVLKSMGIKRAFTDNAEFDNMFNKDIGASIKRIQHKTFIELDEKGTRASAFTSIGMNAMAAKIESVIFNRPFLYMIYDTKFDVPLFIGTVEDFK